MNCDQNMHDEFISQEFVICPFHDEELQPSIKHIPCWDEQDMINHDGSNICKSCGMVNDYQVAKDFIDFHENKYKIVKKSIYHRKYRLENIITENQITLSYHEKLKYTKYL